jgi:hypothetical protein
MKSAILVAVLAVVLPIHGQETRPHSNEHTKNSQSKPESRESPSVGINVVNQETPHAEERRTEKHSQSYLKLLVVPENAPNLGLFVVGSIGVVVAVCTLRTLREQTRQLVESVAASNKNVKALINSERPWMFLEIARLGSYPNTFTIKFTNQGRTPAEVVAFTFNLDCRKSTDDFPLQPRYEDKGTVMVSTRTVAPGKSFTPPGEPVIHLPENFPAEQWTEITSSRERALCWGRLLYRDLIEYPSTIHIAGKDYGTLHETCFCYFWSP